MNQPQQEKVQLPAAGIERPSHPDAVGVAHEHILAGVGARSRYVEAVPGEHVHVIEAGEGPPLVMLHGSGPSALSFAPLFSHLHGAHVMAVDRPGFGLSDPHTWPDERRAAAVGWLDRVLDALDLDHTNLLGSSAGGTWALWYTLARPERVSRLVLMGALPALSATRPPAPMLAIASIDPSNPPPMPRPSRETIIQSMAMMGEASTIVDYPDLVDALVAAGNDPIASRASFDELRTLISPTGWQSAVETSLEELEGVDVPTLVIWGKRDPLGDVDSAAEVAAAIPESLLELVDAGHAPWLGNPEMVARLVGGFV